MAYISPGWARLPDGTPPRILMPGQTILWGTRSNGGFGATTGTGGVYLPAEHDVQHICDPRAVLVSWREPACNIVGAQMLPDGDLVAWDANGDVVKPVCEIAFKHDTGCVWRLVNVTLWSASAKPAPPTP